MPRGSHYMTSGVNFPVLHSHLANVFIETPFIWDTDGGRSKADTAHTESTNRIELHETSEGGETQTLFTLFLRRSRNTIEISVLSFPLWMIRAPSDLQSLGQQWPRILSGHQPKQDHMIYQKFLVYLEDVLRWRSGWLLTIVYIVTFVDYGIGYNCELPAWIRLD